MSRGPHLVFVSFSRLADDWLVLFVSRDVGLFL